MKIIKNITAIAAATAMAAGMSSVLLFAEDAYTLHVDSESASVGETVAVNIVIDTGSTGVGAIAFKLNYDPDELELISAKPGDDLKGWITGDVDSDGNNSLNLSEAGTIGFGYVAMGSGFSGKSASIINASFTVLKPNAKFTLTDVVIGANDIDGTDITEQGSFDDNSVIECSHKNTEENITEATCKDEGKRDVTCIDCGKLVKTETIAKTNDHIWDNGTVTIKPTCDKKGVKTFTCTVCNETKTDEIAAWGHSWDQGEVTKKPTCTEKGIKIFTCSKCNETKTEEIASIGHDWDEWSVTKEATADEEGEEMRECKNCGENETRAIAKLPAESTVTSYSGDGFHVPETTVTSTTPAESQTVTIADTTTSAAVITQNPETTTTAVTAAATKPVDNTTSTSIGNVNTDTPNNENNNVGNTDSGNSDDKNSDTGMMLAVVPAVAAAVGVIMFKKKK